MNVDEKNPRNIRCRRCDGRECAYCIKGFTRCFICLAAVATVSHQASDGTIRPPVCKECFDDLSPEERE